MKRVRPVFMSGRNDSSHPAKFNRENDSGHFLSLVFNIETKYINNNDRFMYNKLTVYREKALSWQLKIYLKKVDKVSFTASLPLKYFWHPHGGSKDTETAKSL